MELLLQMNVVAAVLIIAIVIIRALALYKLPKKTFLFLWGVVALRLLIPFRLPLPFDLFPSQSASPSGMTVSTSEMFYVGGTVAQVPSTVEQTAPMSFPFEAVWITGICIAAIFFLVSYLRFRREANASLPCENEFVAQWLEGHPLRRTVQLRQTDRVSAPLTYGILRPVILLPKTTDWQNEEALCCILTHEHMHIRRFDTLAKLALATLVCIHWFNPLVWVMYILANRDIEISCDEATTNELDVEQKKTYLQVLIALEETKTRMAFPLASHFGKHSTKERMTAIMKKGKYTVPVIIAAVALVLCIGTVAVAAMSESGSIVLFENLSAEEMSAITAYLDEQGEEYKVKGDSLTVSDGDAARLKADLLMQGLPGVGFSYDVYLDNSGSLTEEERESAYLLSLHHRLEETIEEFDGVDGSDAVGVVIGYNLDEVRSATVMIRMSEGYTLTAEQTAAIRKLLTDAVPDLQEENISISTMDGVIYDNVHVDTEVTVRQLTPLEMEVKTQLTTAVQAFDDVELIEVNVWTDKQDKINAEINLEEDNELSAEQFQDVIDLHHSIVPAEQVGFVSVRAMVATKGISYGESGEGTGDGSGPVYDRIYIHDTETGITYEMRNVTPDDIVEIFPGDRYMVQEEAPQRPLDGYTEVYVPGQQDFDSTTAPSWSEGDEKPVPITLIGSFERRYKNQYKLIDETEFSLTADNPSAVYEGASDKDIVISFVDNGPVICIVTIEGVEVPGTYKCGFSSEGAVRLELTPGATYSVEYQRGLKEHSDPTVYTGEIVNASSGIIKVYEAK